MSDVKITRKGVDAEVVSRYLPDFIADGWELKKTEAQIAAELAAIADAEDARIKLEESKQKLAEELAKTEADKKAAEAEEKAIADAKEEKNKISNKHK